jgi:tetratricopeptide (TPR) repeat protein
LIVAVTAHLGSCYYGMGKAKEAMHCYNTAHNRMMSCSPAGKHDPRVIRFDYSKGNVELFILDHPKEALDLYETAIKGMEEHYAPNINACSLFYKNAGLACLKLPTPNLQKALEYIREAERLFKTIPGNNTKTSQWCFIEEAKGDYCLALAQRERQKGQLAGEIRCIAAAKVLYTEFLKVNREIHKGKNGIHPDVATGLRKLGLLAEHCGETEEALELYKEALTMYKQTLAEGHFDTVWTEKAIKRLEALKQEEQEKNIGFSFKDCEIVHGFSRDKASTDFNFTFSPTPPPSSRGASMHSKL